ncbi:AsnC family transcriptional regulator [Streptomyces sp. NPDC094438]|uniref:AsnC family transcriptional regulator n=1 Tax=Streptomyces sp. NPDC094438 TaxID=3366061 RepID=UPI0038078101
MNTSDKILDVLLESDYYDEIELQILHALHLDARVPSPESPPSSGSPTRRSPVATPGCASRAPCASGGWSIRPVWARWSGRYGSAAPLTRQARWPPPSPGEGGHLLDQPHLRRHRAGLLDLRAHPGRRVAAEGVATQRTDPRRERPLPAACPPRSHQRCDHQAGALSPEQAAQPRLPIAPTADRAKSVTLDEFGHRILALLRGDSRAPINQLAAGTGVSHFTVRRRIENDPLEWTP